MKYIQPFPGQYVSMDPTAVIDVYGLIGTPAIWKDHAALVWRVGPSYLFEEALTPESVAAIYRQGTAYLGNFLAPRNTGESQVHMWRNFQRICLPPGLLQVILVKSFSSLINLKMLWLNLIGWHSGVVVVHCYLTSGRAWGLNPRLFVE